MALALDKLGAGGQSAVYVEHDGSLGETKATFREEHVHADQRRLAGLGRTDGDHIDTKAF